MEEINDLVGYKNLKIYQNSEWFKFSLESILLPNFVTINYRDKNILDLCTGNAPIPLVLSTRTKAKIYGVEVQLDIYDLAIKSIKTNGLENQICVINDDIMHLDKVFKNDYFDLITVNPPYFKNRNDKLYNKDIHKTIARHETLFDLDDLFRLCYRLLKNNGRIGLVHRTERLVEVIETLRKYKLEPKTIQFIYPKENGNSNMFMMEATKNGKDGLKIINPIFVHNNDGTYRQEIMRIFNNEV